MTDKDLPPQYWCEFCICKHAMQEVIDYSKCPYSAGELYDRYGHSVPSEYYMFTEKCPVKMNFEFLQGQILHLQSMVQNLESKLQLWIDFQTEVAQNRVDALKQKTGLFSFISLSKYQRFLRKNKDTNIATLCSMILSPNKNVPDNIQEFVCKLRAIASPKALQREIASKKNEILNKQREQCELKKMK